MAPAPMTTGPTEAPFGMPQLPLLELQGDGTRFGDSSAVTGHGTDGDKADEAAEVDQVLVSGMSDHSSGQRVASQETVGGTRAAPDMGGDPTTHQLAPITSHEEAASPTPGVVGPLTAVGQLVAEITSVITSPILQRPAETRPRVPRRRRSLVSNPRRSGRLASWNGIFAQRGGQGPAAHHAAPRHWFRGRRRHATL